MRDLMRRLDRLESLKSGPDAVTTIIRFMVPPPAPGLPPEPVAARCVWSVLSGGSRDSEEIQREPGETAKDFEARASAYFHRAVAK